MTTLRRQAKQKIAEVLNEYIASGMDYLGESIPDEVLDRIVDALSNLRGFSMLKPFDEEKAGLDWAIVSGASKEKTTKIVDKGLWQQEAIEQFERSLVIQLDWYPAKTSSDKAMRKLRENVVKWYTEDQNCFRDYQTWRTQPFVKGALSNVQIKSFPENFEASWSDFRRANPLKITRAVKTDDNDSPITY